jgi:hypothetical protein
VLLTASILEIFGELLVSIVAGDAPLCQEV